MVQFRDRPESVSDPEGRRARRRNEVRERIKRAAMELFREKGYAAATVEEIAERADVARGTFFNHFPRKDALLSAAADDSLEDVEDELGPIDQWRGSARDQIERYFLGLARHAGADRELFKTILIEETRQFWMCEDDSQDAGHQRFRNTIHAVLQLGRERGELSPDVPLDGAMLLLEGLHVITIIEWIRRGGSLDEFRAQLAPSLDIIFRGMAGDPPRPTDG